MYSHAGKVFAVVVDRKDTLTVESSLVALSMVDSCLQGVTTEHYISRVLHIQWEKLKLTLGRSGWRRLFL